ncbi:FAD binding domain-containing protein [Amycolatopsis sp. NPDC059027]|uniref:FAD binding domain-containing protein n=1 Tax=Amycolatopsis sp. NPDC059027 TaxID=3346709 RepID=UPI00366B6D90
MKPASFSYHRARDVPGATRSLAELGDEAKVIAGGQSLVPMMNFRLARPRHLVDVGGLRELRYLRTADDGLHIGALTTHHDVETAPESVTGPGFAVLREGMRWLGHLPIRTRGTIGGSLAHGDATAEWGLLTVLLDARVVAENSAGRRRVIPAGELFLGFFTTTLDHDELIVEVIFPHRAPHAAITEFARRHGDFATVAAAVSLEMSDGEVHSGRIVLGGVAEVPCRSAAAEAALAEGGPAGPELFERCAEAAAEAIDPPSDANGSADYRRALTRELVTAACAKAASR